MKIHFFEEFKAFIRRGSVIDLAIGIIIGTAFNKIVSSLVADMITPVIGFLTAGIKFTSLRLKLGGPADNPAFINYGNFLQASFDFVIVAIAAFFLVKAFHHLKRKEDAKPAAPTAQELLLTEIRDLLKEQKLSATKRA